MHRDEQFKHLFYTHYNALCVTAYHYLLDKDLAEDVVQETLIKFWELGKDSLSDLKTGYYLRQAVKNNCVSELRRRRNDVSMDNHFLESFDLASEEESEERQNHLLERLDAAIGELPERCREVFLLSKMKQMKQQEVADRLGISVKTVENQMTKAIAMLRKSFGVAGLFLLVLLKWLIVDKL